MLPHFPSLRRAGPRAGLVLLLPGLLLLAGCGTQAQNALRSQRALAACLHDAQTEPTDTKARHSADLAIAVAPQDPVTYLGPTSSNPNDPLSLSLALIFTDVGDTSALADYMTQAVQKFPNDERGYQILIEAQKQLGQTTAQKATASKLVTLLNSKLKGFGTTDIRTQTDELAQAYFDSGDTVNGAATYKKVIQAYPTEPEAYNNLAYAYAVRGTNLPEALSLAQQALTLAQKKGNDDVTVAGYQDTLGWVQYQQGNYADAEQNLLQAANMLPRLAETRYHLGLVYIAQGKMDAARAELDHAVFLSQGYVAALQARDTLPKAAVAKSP